MKHPDGRHLRMDEPEWFKGKHDAVIDQEIFDQCQAVRLQRASSHEHYPKHRTYLLRNLIYCADCVANMPPEVEDDQYGKMRPHSNDGYLLYRCRARDFGRSCPQKSVQATSIDEQVVTVLKTIKPPADWRNRMVQAMGQLLGDQKLEERIAEIKAIIERMDFRWDNGFITDREAYLEQRVKLQQELEKLTPIPDNDLETAADLLENFEHHWRATGGDKKRQAALVQLIVARVWVRKDRVVAVSLRPNYHVAVGLGTEKPTELQVDFEDCNIVRNRGRRVSNPRSLP
ncbi:MAG: zinc ribbon domain-containing protein [Anaerolineae bacterium]|nr:zinc ribbon domain-containing protein [Anaerolineae bacterium]